MKYLIITNTTWDEPPRARHQVTYALAKKNKVIFVEGNKVGLPKLVKREINKHITLYSPSFFLDRRIRYRFKFLNNLYFRWLLNRLEKEISKDELRVVNFDFTATSIYKKFRNVVYYCNDNFSHISSRLNPKFIARYHEKSEKYIAENSKFCIATSEVIRQILLPYNTNTYTLELGGPNLDDYDIKVDATLKKKDEIIIGLVGYISSYNISVELINDILNIENSKLVLIGPVKEEFKKQVDLSKNIELRGTLTDAALYNAIAELDVAIAPYAKEKLLEGGTPNKLWQYLSLGKPAVVSNLASLKYLDVPDHLIYVAKEYMDFSKLILKAYEENSDDLIRQRIEAAKNNTWDSRIETLLELYEKHDQIDNAKY